MLPQLTVTLSVFQMNALNLPHVDGVGYYQNALKDQALPLSNHAKVVTNLQLVQLCNNKSQHSEEENSD